MEMTKERLSAYRSNRDEIKELTWILENRWKSDSMIHVDTILNYSKGYPIPEGIVGFNKDKYERLQNRDLKRKEWLKKENEEIEEFVNKIEESQIRRIFRLYFLDGYKNINQTEVAKKIHIDRSRVSRKIDEYLKNAHKAQNAQL